jgi:hypothetical protein
MTGINGKNIACVAACLAEYVTRGMSEKEVRELLAFLSIFDASIRAILQMRCIE